MRPIRCFTCGKVLGNKWEVIDKLKTDECPMIEIYKIFGVTRYCCKKMVMTSHKDDENINYILPNNVKILENKEPNFIKII
jgi:DNA-directed RNA polymerase subunit N (RpoN/RPB10)